MTFEEWERGVPACFRGDPLWRVAVYRKALYLADLAWPDVTRLAADRRTVSLSDQLYRAVGSIGANVSEGYSKSSRRDRVRFYEYALGSARESRGWYHGGRFVLGDAVSAHRMDLASEIIRLLLTMISRPEPGSFA